jgi:tetraacyldisaccharide 4'-kinase
MQLPLLSLFKLLFFPLVRIRNWLYDKNFLPICRFPEAYIVSVGNLSIGGTGKTPLTIELLEQLKDLPIALISRGYKGKYQKKDLPLIVCASASPLNVGDEPLIIKQRVSEALVVVDPDRVRGAKFAIEQGRSLLFLDDGMQHRRLGRDLEIVILNGEDPFGGWLREPPNHLNRADYVVVMGGSFTPKEIPFVRMRRCLFEGLELKGKKVGLFCGVGQPKQVLDMVQREGAEVLEHWFLPDHATPSQEKLRNFATLCENRGAQVILCTEKDRVKLSSPLSLSLPVSVLKIRLEVLEGLDTWREILTRCRRGIKK